MARTGGIGCAGARFQGPAVHDFEAPDPQRFPGLDLAWQVLAGPVGSTAVLNAANEVAVQAFLDRRIRFDQIHTVNRDALQAWSAPRVGGIEDLLGIDANARLEAQALVRKLAAHDHCARLCCCAGLAYRRS